MPGLVTKIGLSSEWLKQPTCRAATLATAICASIHSGIPYAATRVLKLSSPPWRQGKISQSPGRAPTASGRNQAVEVRRLQPMKAGNLRRDNRDLSLTLGQIANRRQVMKYTQCKMNVRILAAMLVAVAVVILST